MPQKQKGLYKAIRHNYMLTNPVNLEEIDRFLETHNLSIVWSGMATPLLFSHNALLIPRPRSCHFELK